MNTVRNRVLLTEDHVLVRQGLRTLLGSEADMEVVGEVGDGRKAVALARQLQPDVVLMDLSLPLLNGLEATRQIKRSSPQVKVLILSAHTGDHYLNEAKEAGAAGYLIKQNSIQDLAAAIRKINRGCPFLSSVVSGQEHAVASRERSTLFPAPQSTELSGRQREILQLVAEGKANKQVASELSISIKTVEKHRQSLMDKLGIHETAGLTRYAIAAGIIESEIVHTL